MTKETKSILADAISDIGYWRWWITSKDRVQVEFGGVELFDETKEGKEARSSVIALRFSGNAFIVFLSKRSAEDLHENWYEELQGDRIEPFGIEAGEFIFDDFAYVQKLYEEYEDRYIPSEKFDWTEVEKAKQFLAVKCFDVAFIVGGDAFSVVGSKPFYSDEDIKDMSQKWWQYWKEYWELRDTEQAYEKDYACEVTIPVHGAVPE